MGECHDWCLKTDALPLADVFENFRKMWFGISQLNPAEFLLAPRLAWQAALKKSK